MNQNIPVLSHLHFCGNQAVLFSFLRLKYLGNQLCTLLPLLNPIQMTHIILCIHNRKIILFILAKENPPYIGCNARRLHLLPPSLILTPILSFLYEPAHMAYILQIFFPVRIQLQLSVFPIKQSHKHVLLYIRRKLHLHLHISAQGSCFSHAFCLS